MSQKTAPDNFISLDSALSIWERVFTVAPLVVIGSKGSGGQDLAPKHMATPLGFGNYFGFVCTPRHHTYSNVKETGVFTVSFPTPEQVVSISLSATPRQVSIPKWESVLAFLPTVKAFTLDLLMIEGAYLYLECELHRIVDGFDDYSLISGKVRHAYVHKDYLRSSDKEENSQIREHPLLAYVAQGRYASINETFNFPFPKDFKR